MILNKNYFCIYFLIFFVSIGFTQEKVNIPSDSISTDVLDPVFLTATRTSRKSSTLPIPIQIITESEIKSSNSLRLNDILNEQTGLITTTDFGGGEGIQIQGLDPEYTLILIDGAPIIGRLSGTLDLKRFSLGNIKQIDVVKGASSSLYGSAALAGVINIITKLPKDGFSGDLNYRFSTYNTNDVAVSLNYKKNKVGINAYFNRLNSDGYNLSDSEVLNTVEPFTNYTFSTKLTYDFTPKTDLFLSTRYYNQNQDFIASETLSGKSYVREWNTHLKINHIYNLDWKIYFEFYTSKYKADEFLDDSNGSRFSEGFYDQLLIKPEIRVKYSTSSRAEFIAGVGFNHETLDRSYFTMNPIFNSPYIFIQHDSKPTENLNIIIGARFDSHNEYKSQFSPKLAFRHQFNNQFSVSGSLGYGFKAPDFRQLYFDFTNTTIGYTVLGYNAVSTAIPILQQQGQIANLIIPVSEFENELKPESSVAVNIGADYDLNQNLKFEFNFFRNSIKNLIDTQVIANKTNGQNVFSYFNINQVYTQGLELNMYCKLGNSFKLSSGYQLLYAFDKAAKNSFENGEVFARENPSSPSFELSKSDYFGLFNRSRHMANLKINYTNPISNIDSSLRIKYRSKYGLLDSNGNGYLDSYDSFVNSYVVVDLGVNKKMNDNYYIGAGIDNLLNFTDTQNITNISGRIIYAKLNIQF